MTVTSKVATSFPSRVLVVDDEPLVLEVFERLLPEAGLEMRGAATGEEGLALLAKEGFGCLVTDKNLPGVDGVEVMRGAKRLQPFCGIIMMTGYASTASAVEALRLGATDYLEKPFTDLDLVLSKIERAVRQQRISYERDVLSDQIKGFRTELQAKDKTVYQQQTEIEMFNLLLEARVRQATDDLERQLQVMQKAMTGNKPFEIAMRVQTESMLEVLRATWVSDDTEPGVMRALLARVVRLLEQNLRLMEIGAERLASRGPASGG